MSHSRANTTPQGDIGFTYIELLLTLALASGLSLSLLGFLLSKQPETLEQTWQYCTQGYWQAQQKLDEKWMFGESSDEECKQDKWL